jgi:hypothetical protein
MSRMERTQPNELCPACEHPRLVKPRAGSFLRSLFGLAPAPAECRETVHDVSGWGGVPCGCIDPTHGS